jgi:hypothetical protein
MLPFHDLMERNSVMDDREMLNADYDLVAKNKTQNSISYLRQ